MRVLHIDYITTNVYDRVMIWDFICVQIHSNGGDGITVIHHGVNFDGILFIRELFQMMVKYLKFSSGSKEMKQPFSASYLVV